MGFDMPEDRPEDREDYEKWEQEQVAVPTGPNPNYKPPVPQWHLVEIIAPEGYTFGVCLDANGELGIAVKPPGGEWPSGDLKLSGINTIEPGRKCYQVINDGR